MSQNNNLISSEYVRSKQFSKPGFGREGYRADEVRYFLQQISNTIKEYEEKNTNSSNPDLTKELYASKRKISELEKALASNENNVDKSEVETLKQQLKEAQDEVVFLENAHAELAEELRASKSAKGTENTNSATQVLSLAEKTATELVENAEAEALERKNEILAQLDEEANKLKEENAKLVKANEWLIELEADNKEKIREFYRKNLQALEEEFIDPIPFEYIVGTDDINDESVKANAGDDELFDTPNWHDENIER